MSNVYTEFREVLNKALKIYTIRELGGLFEVIPSTVKRWSEGKSTPMLGVQKLVIRVLKKKLKDQ